VKVKTSRLDYVRMGLKGLCLDGQQSDITGGVLSSKSIAGLVEEKLKDFGLGTMLGC